MSEIAQVTEKFGVRSRWSDRIKFTAEITCAPDATIGVKLGLAVQWGYRNDAVLSDADLRGAVLRNADLSGADLRNAVLSDAVLRGVPVIPNIHQTIYAAASRPGALNMRDWHCGTSHCRAGWAVELAGEEGKALEERLGTPAAANLIYLASDPNIDRMPSFYCDDATALADMKRLAELEAAKTA